MYTVKAVAELLGVSVHTVRYYDDRGLIPGTKRNAANQRLFDDMEVEWFFKPNLEKYRSIPKRCKALHRTISTG